MQTLAVFALLFISMTSAQSGGVEPVAPTTTYGMMVDVGKVATNADAIEIQALWTTDLPTEDPVVLLRSTAILGGTARLSAIEARDLAVVIRTVAESADQGQAITRGTPGAAMTVEATNQRGAMSMRISMKPEGGLRTLRSIDCTVDQGFSLARALSRAAGNAAWIKVQMANIRPGN